MPLDGNIGMQLMNDWALGGTWEAGCRRLPARHVMAGSHGEAGMRQGSFALVLLAGVLLWPLAAVAGERVDYIARIFRDADFVPHVPLAADVIARYGNGSIRRERGEAKHAYLDPRTGLAVQVSVDEGPAPAYRFVDEIALGLPGDARHPDGHLENLKGVMLLGVGIGAAQEEAIRVAEKHRGPSVEPSTWLGRPATRLMFFPWEEDANTYCLYYVQAGRVVAMAVGVTE